jgi:hypothetical protein
MLATIMIIVGMVVALSVVAVMVKDYSKERFKIDGKYPAKAMLSNVVNTLVSVTILLLWGIKVYLIIGVIALILNGIRILVDSRKAGK